MELSFIFRRVLFRFATWLPVHGFSCWTTAEQPSSHYRAFFRFNRALFQFHRALFRIATCLPFHGLSCWTTAEQHSIHHCALFQFYCTRLQFQCALLRFATWLFVQSLPRLILPVVQFVLRYSMGYEIHMPADLIYRSTNLIQRRKL